jgi:hypothetical protein
MRYNACACVLIVYYFCLCLHTLNSSS